MTRGTWIVAAAAAVAVLWAGGSAQAGSVAGANGQIVYVKNDASQVAQIWIANSDGSDQTELTTDGANHYNPKWSPDAAKIAYTSYPTPSNASHAEIYVLSVASPSSQTQLTNLGGVNANPAWSPDGTKIAFDHSCDIWVMNADGSNPTQLTHDWVQPFFLCNGQPTWSPDGTEIAYTHQVSGGNHDVDAVKTDGSGATRTIVGTGDFEGAPAWSPDGTTIAYDHAATAHSSDLDVYTVPATGGAGTPVTNDGSTTGDFSPQWSPDSTKLIWSAGTDVDVVPRGGGAATTLASSNTNANPDWAVRTAPSSIRVTRLDDPAGAGSCPGDCSLRQAVAAVASGGTVSLPAGTYRLTQAQLLLDRALTLTGAGSTTTTIEQTAHERVLDVAAALTLSGVTVTGGNTLDGGSDPDPCTGGGIRIEPGITAHLFEVTVRGNHADCGGGGIEDEGTLTVDRATIEANTAGSAFAGGGMHLVVEGPLVMRNTLVASNTAGHGGGVDAANSGSQLTFVNDTIARNTGPLSGDGLEVVGAPTTLTNTILDHNGGVNCSDATSTVVSGGHNISSDSSCPFGAAGDRRGVDPQLDASFVPRAGSPAVDGGDDASCPSPDRQGNTRPQGAHCDVGAFETSPHPPPTAVLTADVSGSTVSVDGSQSSASGGTIVSYTWDFGDGTGGTGVTASHTYTTPGTYTVTLTVTDGNGGSATATRTVTIEASASSGSGGGGSPPSSPPAPPPLQARFVVAPATGDAATVFTFDAAGSTGAIASYTWSFGDGAGAQGATATHVFGAAGVYTATLVVADASGATASTTRSVVVGEPGAPPTIDVRPRRPVAGRPATFILTRGGFAVAGAVTWRFGDRGTATGASASHTYSTAGRYVVTATLTDGSGQAVSAQRDVVVLDAPAVTFAYSPVPPVAGTATHFAGSVVRRSGSTRSTAIVAWRWTFGDGSTATTQRPAHQFAQPGTYTVTCTVTDASGVTGTSAQSLAVQPGDVTVSDVVGIGDSGLPVDAQPVINVGDTVIVGGGVQKRPRNRQRRARR